MRLLGIPLSRPIVIPKYRITSIFTVLCEVGGSRDGPVGRSALWFLATGQAKVVMEALRYLAPLVSPDWDRSRADLRREINFLGYKGVSVMAIAALQMAVNDRDLRERGEALGKPRLHGRVPAYWSGFYLNDDDKQWAAEARTAVDRGFRAFKARVGSASVDEDVRRIQRLREVLPPGATLMLDANQAWDPSTAIEASRRLQPLSICWLEDPLVHNDYRGLADVVKGSPIAIAGGENEYLHEGFQQLLESGLQYLLADLERVGGFDEWSEVASLARERGATLTPHLYPHVAVRLCAALEQRETWLEYTDWWEPLMEEPLKVDAGDAIPGTSPGSGFDPAPAAVAKYALAPWETLG
jgi:mandelate racemase